MICSTLKLRIGKVINDKSVDFDDLTAIQRKTSHHGSPWAAPFYIQSRWCNHTAGMFLGLGAYVWVKMGYGVYF